jgi:predicted DNA-binding transcriptional regulator AlpA
MNNRYMSKTNTAKYLGISRKTLYKMELAGLMGPAPICLAGDLKRYDAQEIDKWIHTSNPPPNREKWKILKNLQKSSGQTQTLSVG